MKRVSLPEPKDTIGKQKETLATKQMILFWVVTVAIIAWRGYAPRQPFPARSVVHDENLNSPFPLPVLGLCFPKSTFQGWKPVVWRMSHRKNYYANKTATCEHWSPDGRHEIRVERLWGLDNLDNEPFQTPEQLYSCNSTKSLKLEDNCANVVQIDSNQQCVSFGNENCPMWQALRNFEVVEVQLLAFWDRINQFPTTTPGGWYDNSKIFFSNTSAYRTQILLGGVSQAILEFKREECNEPNDWFGWDVTRKIQYPTSITTLNMLDDHLSCQEGTLVDTNQMCFNTRGPYGTLHISVLELQIRLETKVIVTTTIESGWDYLLRIIADIGGILSAWVTFVAALFKLITWCKFSQPDAFFDTEIRLAATHFQNVVEKPKEE